MTCTQALLTLLLISPCSDDGGASLDLTLAESLAHPERLETDRVRDPLRRPADVLGFFGLQAGMNVLDLFSGGGYYTEILSRAVGPDGSVTAHNNQAYVDYVAEELQARYAGDRLDNVERLVAEAGELDLPPNSFDLALVVLTWHDFYYVDPENGWEAIDEPALTRTLCGALKPGAVLGVIDHVADAGADVRETAQTLHRIDPQRIKDDLADSCFTFEAESTVLRNAADDHAQPMFDPAVRGRTDRVVYRFRRS
ncbi:class I SAM-dependent methyltransferase [Elongatibacter sediminis]|uniref:Methyltransferase domain-containing protein n=1 Tax=Elongatibacter sediminis TaxID=3119006 RepID=A0AAW9RIY9_9GAMM